MTLATLSEIFDKLLADRKLAISRDDRKSAEILRMSLTRKLVQYKQQMGSVGYLDDDIAAAIVSLEWGAPSTATYFLRPRKKNLLTYNILATAEVTEATEDEQ